jgi:phage/plasmid-like protein (TIGR03299 family)
MGMIPEKSFTVREPAWHGMSVVLASFPGREQAMKLAGHDFEVLEQSIYAVDIIGQAQQIMGWKGLFRSDTNKLLAVVKATYEVIQNAQIWDILDALVQEPHVQYETGGTLAEGAVIWALARLMEAVTIKGDNSQIYPFVNVSSTHDGSGAAKAFVTSIRTVCENTMSAGMSEASRSGLNYTFRHTKNVKDRIAFARSALGLARKEFSAFCEMASDLACKQVSFEQVKLFLEGFIPAPPEALTSSRVKDNIEQARMLVLNTLNESVSIAEPHRRTAYGLYCAGSEYLDHLRAYRTPETHFKRCIMDTSRSKEALMQLVQEVL